jgi:hypothetical protein
LGHAKTDDWASVRERYLRSALLRGIRLYGPTYLAARHGSSGCDGYCETCFAFADDERVAAGTAEMFARPTARLVEQQAVALQQREGALAFARRFGLRRYADLITLGYTGAKEPECVA